MNRRDFLNKVRRAKVIKEAQKNLTKGKDGLPLLPPASIEAIVDCPVMRFIWEIPK